MQSVTNEIDYDCFIPVLQNGCTQFPLKDRNCLTGGFPHSAKNEAAGLSLTFNVTPPQRKKKQIEESYELILEWFVKSPKIAFEKVAIGRSKTIPLHIKNPSPQPVNVAVAKFPTKSGFSSQSHEFSIAPHETYVMDITWVPVEKGNLRECITFKTDTNLQVNAVLLGSAETKPKPKKRSRQNFQQENKAPHIQPIRHVQPTDKTSQVSRSNNSEGDVAQRAPQQRTVLTGADCAKTTICRKTFVGPRDRWCHPQPVREAAAAIPKKRFKVLNSGPSTKTSISRPKVIFKQKDGLPDTKFDEAPTRRNTYLVKTLPEPQRALQDSIDESCCNFEDSLEFPNADENLSYGKVQKDGLLGVEGNKQPSEGDCMYKGMSCQHEWGKEEITNRSKPRKKWNIQTAVNVTDEIFGLKPESSSHGPNDHKPNSSSHEIIGSQHGDYGHSNNTSDFSFLPPSDQDIDRRCSTGIKANPPSFHLVGSANLISNSAFSEDLFPDGPIDNLSNAVSRLSSETYTASTPSSPIELNKVNSPPVDNSVTNFEETASVGKNVQLVNLPVIDKESTVGYVSSPVRRPFARSAKTSPKKLINRKHMSNISMGHSRRKMPKKLSPKKPAKIEQLCRKERSKPSAKRPVPGIPQRKLTLIKPKRRSSIPHHPNPFAAKNMFYDERWIDKQERGFTRWLNFILTPPEEFSTSVETTKVDAGKLWIECTKNYTVPKAPTKEDLSFKTYTARKRLNRLRKAACILFQSEPVIRVISKLEAEIEKERILVRADRAVHADLGMKQRILDMIVCYNPLWLRIGLETTFGEILPLQSNSDVLGMSRFIIRRLLNNPDLAKEYAHPSVPHLYRPGYEGALKKFTLKKFLLLIYFLDRAKLTRLIDHDPCLFCVNATFKSSRDLLLAFSRDYLSGEGDLTKHLSYLGYVVSHEQTYLEEFDYAVTNIAVDLRCGVRLMKVTSLLLNEWPLLQKARVPAISKLQKVHNVEVALKALAKASVKIESGIASKDICEGHREKTLNLLWQIIFKFQIEVLLSKSKLAKEINYLQQNWRLLRKTLAFKTTLKSQGGSNNPEIVEMYYKSENLQLLMHWCRAVCTYYDMNIDNFTVSFSDGRALCFLIHHYHPSLISLSDIQTATTQTINGNGNPDSSSTDDSFQENWTHTFSPTTGKPTAHQELLNNERKNFKLAFEKLEELGGVPILTQANDMSNTIPDEKVLITLLTFLNVRLMDLSDEIRAVRVIQLAWRNHKIRKQLAQTKLREAAAVKLQRAVRQLLINRRLRQQSVAASEIQAAFKSYLLRKRFRRTKIAAQSIQRFYRSKKAAEVSRNQFLSIKHAVEVLQRTYRAKKLCRDYNKLKQSTTVIQSYVRGHQQRKHYYSLKRATCVIQKHWRSRSLMVSARSEFLEKKMSAVKIQSWYRCKIAEGKFKRLCESCVLIQSCFRRFQTRRKFLRMKVAIVKIETWYDSVLLMKQIRNNFIQKKLAAILIQACTRRFLARHRYEIERNSVIKMQACVRGFQAKRKYKRILRSISTLQRFFRLRRQAQKEREKFIRMKTAAVTIQRSFQSYKIRKEFCTKRSSAITIQKHFKGVCQRNKFLQQLQAAKTIQKYYRSYAESRCQRERFLKIKSKTIILQCHWRRVTAIRRVHRERCAQKIQCAVRGRIIRNRYQKFRTCALKIQCWWRMISLQIRYREMVSATTIIQNYYRNAVIMRKERDDYIRRRTLVILVQSKVRTLICRRNYLQMKHSTIVLQSNYRRHKLQKQFKTCKKSAVIIQRRFRACKDGQRQLKRYHILREACIAIQAWLRRIQTQSFYRKQRQACILIQCHVRTMIMVKQYQNDRKVVIQIQRRFRARQLAVATCAEYHKVKRAAIVIQSAFRMYVVRKNIVMLHHSATKIQSNYRSYAMRKKYQTLRRATITLQHHLRLYQGGCKIRAQYISLKQAAVIIQSYFRRHQLLCELKYVKKVVLVQSQVRRYLAKKEFIRKHAAAITIQKQFRRFTQRQKFCSLKEAVITLQKKWRATLMAKAERENYLKFRSGVVRLQARVRAVAVREEFHTIVQKIILIQAFFRKYLLRARYLKIKKATVTIQRQLRAVLHGRQVRSRYLSDQRKILLSQACIRRYVALKNYQSKRRAIIKIQAFYRGHLELERYKKQISSVRILQERWRAHEAGKNARIQYSTTVTKVIRTQAVVRGFLARSKRNHQRHNAVIIQNWYRSSKQRQRFLRERNATILLQRHFRAFFMARDQRTQYKIWRSQIILLQALFRGNLARWYYRKQQRSAVLIQSNLRSLHCQRRYKALKKSAVCIQTWWHAYSRMVQQRNVYLTYRKSVIICQSMFRRYCCMRNYQRMTTSVVVIQAAFRRFTARRHYHTLRSAALCIQMHWKNYLAMQRTRSEYILKKYSAIKIQAAVRGLSGRKAFQKDVTLVCKVQANIKRNITRKNYLQLRAKTCLIQSWYRSVLLTRKARFDYKNTINSCLRIQSCVRGYQARKKYLNCKSLIIDLQACVRGHQCRKKAALKLKAVKTLQNYVHSYIAGKQCREKYLEQRRSAIVIQSAFRTFKAQRLLKKHKAAKRIQTCVRKYQQQKKFRRTLRQIIIVQGLGRGILAKRRLKELKRENYAAKVIQSSFRSYIDRKRLLEEQTRQRQRILRFTAGVYFSLKVIRIQRFYRNARAREQARNELQSVLLLQHCIRGWLARKHFLKTKRGFVLLQQLFKQWLQERHANVVIIQSHVRVWLAQRAAKQRQKAILTIQAAWRSYKVRKTAMNKKLKIVWENLRVATKKATEEMKLCNRTTSAIDYLLGYKSITMILSALQHLDVVTRLSSVCCEKLAEANVVQTIFILVQGCNRSMPHMEVIKYSVNILLNLSKYGKTVSSVRTVDGCLDTLLELMAIFREKGEVIFTKCATLLWIIMQDSAFSEKMRIAPKVVDKIQSLNYLINRKHKMKEQRQLVKTKMNTSRFDKSSRFGKKASKCALEIQPDWILGKHHFREFSDPHQSISQVMKSLLQSSSKVNES